MGPVCGAAYATWQPLVGPRQSSRRAEHDRTLPSPLSSTAPSEPQMGAAPRTIPLNPLAPYALPVQTRGAGFRFDATTLGDNREGVSDERVGGADRIARVGGWMVGRDSDHSGYVAFL